MNSRWRRIWRAVRCGRRGCDAPEPYAYTDDLLPGMWAVVTYTCGRCGSSYLNRQERRGPFRLRVRFYRPRRGWVGVEVDLIERPT